MSDVNNQLEKLMKEIKKIQENQIEMNNKIEKMQEIINHIENDIYSEEGFDFEIVCPYCENEFVVDMDENMTEVKCPECENIIELDWSGDMEDGGCQGHCHGCHGCEDTDEDDDM